jgi:hypothetical protein
MADVIDGFIIALFCICTLLAISFKSFTQPSIVMIAIPFGLVGAVAGHLLMDFNLSFISLFGMVGLAGVVVNDSLVLIDATNRLRREGATPHQAIVNAGGLVNRMFLKRRHFDPGIPQQAGEGPKSAATGVMDDKGSVISGISRLPAHRFMANIASADGELCQRELSQRIWLRKSLVLSWIGLLKKCSAVPSSTI